MQYMNGPLLSWYIIFVLRLANVNEQALGQMVTFCTGDQERISETVVIIVLLFGKHWTFFNKWQTC